MHARTHTYTQNQHIVTLILNTDALKMDARCCKITIPHTKDPMYNNNL